MPRSQLLTGSSLLSYVVGRASPLATGAGDYLTFGASWSAAHYPVCREDRAGNVYAGGRGSLGGSSSTDPTGRGRHRGDGVNGGVRTQAGRGRILIEGG